MKYKFILFFWILSEISFSQQLNAFYEFSSCGLNFTHQSVVLGKRMEANGLPFIGVEQPAEMVINNLPVQAVIEKAFLWWSTSGSSTSVSVTFKNPDDVEETIPGTLIGSGADKCWSFGGSQTFRADVTHLISGNGSYHVSGLSTGFNLTDDDTDGASLFIVYSNPFDPFIGHISISDGSILALMENKTFSIPIIPSTELTMNATAMMLISDLQGAGSTLSMNNSAYLGVSESFWDFETKSTAITNGQATANFGIKSPNDCVNIIMAGVYYTYPYTINPATIFNLGDTLIAENGVSYNWYLNNQPLGIIDSSFVSTIPGTYYVDVEDEAGCKVSSNEIQMTCFENFMANIFLSGRMMNTSATYTSFQWYFDGLPIEGADSNSFFAIDSGRYYVEVTNALGCTYVSNELHITTNYISNIVSHLTDNKDFINLYPNPNNGRFQLNFKNSYKNVNLTLYNQLGKVVYTERIDVISENNTIEMNIVDSGFYYLVISTNETNQYIRLVVN
jgi:hypothetical protein